MKKVYLVTIRTKNKNKEWSYEPNTEIIIPVLASTRYFATKKIETQYSGSEYPEYDIISAKECDKFLFKPLL